MYATATTYASMNP